MALIPELTDRLLHRLWHTDPQHLPAWHRLGLFWARLLAALARDLTQEALSLRASSLVYNTLLSLVPLLAVSFSVLKGFGAHNQLEPLLDDLLEPLGEHGREVTARLLEFVDNTNVGVLGTLGLVFLLYSVVLLIGKIEAAFNATWQVPQSRPLVQRFSQYLSVLLIGPVLLVSALGATASLRGTPWVQDMVAIQPLGLLLDTGGRLVPYLLIVLAFAFAYLFVPNTRVQPRSALLGAAVAGLLWQVVGWLFAHFMAGSTQYAAIYSSLAILILFMLWLQLAWLILLLGASIAFYHQYPEYLTARTRDLRLSNRLRERLALALLVVISERYQQGAPPCTLERLAHRLRVPVTNVRNVLTMLEQGGFVLRTAGEPAGFAPARPPATMAVRAVLESIRRHGEQDLRTEVGHPNPALAALEARLDQARADALGELTLGTLATMAEPGTEGGPVT